MGQVISLVEVLARRRAAGLHSFLGFIDLKSAFDCVPHAALFARLRQVGVVGPTLRFLTGLYASSVLEVRFGDGSMSDVYPLERGVRQGCPLSPVLFDVFIDSLFEDWVDDEGLPMAVSVPCSVGPPLSLPGLFFFFFFYTHAFKEPTHGLRSTHSQPNLFHIHPTLPHSHGNHRAGYTVSRKNV